MHSLIKQISKCTLCAQHLPLGPRPVVAAHPKSKIVIIGQAPGTKVHASGIPWDDQSGENLRAWMGVDKDTFYDVKQMAIMPMGFCYPGRGKSGDLPPRKECAPEWHDKLMDGMKNVKLTLLIGKYAQDYYIGKRKAKNLTETVANFEAYLPDYFVLPHPSPRNNIWMKKNAWFKEDVLPELKGVVKSVIGDEPRARWGNRFKKMTAAEDDELLIPDVFKDEKFDDWK